MFNFDPLLKTIEQLQHCNPTDFDGYFETLGLVFKIIGLAISCSFLPILCIVGTIIILVEAPGFIARRFSIKNTLPDLIIKKTKETRKVDGKKEKYILLEKSYERLNDVKAFTKAMNTKYIICIVGSIISLLILIILSVPFFFTELYTKNTITFGSCYFIIIMVYIISTTLVYYDNFFDHDYEYDKISCTKKDREIINSLTDIMYCGCDAVLNPERIAQINEKLKEYGWKCQVIFIDETNEPKK